MKCHYAYRQRCHSIPAAEFDYELKAWKAPIESLPIILSEFEGEIYFKTPLWKIKGEPRPKEESTAFFAEPARLPEVTLTPFDYQVKGAQFMIDRLEHIGFVLLGDGVGLGKTLEAIITMKYYMEHHNSRRFLIVCKKSLKHQWAAELKRILGDEGLPVFVTGATKKKRQEAYMAFNDSEDEGNGIGILVTNYENFLNDFDILNILNFDFCLIDEAHCVKSGKKNKAISKICSGKPTLLLTATPVMSRPEDLHGIVSLADPNFFGPMKIFEEKFLVKEFTIYGWQTVGARNLDFLKFCINKFYIARTAEEVFANSPDNKKPPEVTESILRAEMDDVQRKMYEVINKQKTALDEQKEAILGSGLLTPESEQKIEELNEKGKMFLASLQLISDDPMCFKYLAPEHGINKYIASIMPKSYKMSAKTEITVDMVKELYENDEKILIFCHFYSPARLLFDCIKEALGVEPLMYTGAENEEKRKANVEKFCANDNCLPLICTEAAAEGLNLHYNCNKVLHYNQPDTYAQKNQRTGRIARIGSKYTRAISYNVITEESFDEVKLAKIDKDKKITTALLK